MERMNEYCDIEMEGDPKVEDRYEFSRVVKTRKRKDKDDLTAPTRATDLPETGLEGAHITFNNVSMRYWFNLFVFKSQDDIQNSTITTVRNHTNRELSYMSENNVISKHTRSSKR